MFKAKDKTLAVRMLDRLQPIPDSSEELAAIYYGTPVTDDEVENCKVAASQHTSYAAAYEILHDVPVLSLHWHLRYANLVGVCEAMPPLLVTFPQPGQFSEF